MPTRILQILPLVWSIFASSCFAEVHELRTRGRTLVEAEDFAATSAQYPYSEPCKKCSGQQNLGYFWKDSWFELEVEVPEDTKFKVTLRVASEEGGKLAVAKAEKAGELERLLAVEIPQTGEWNQYTETKPVEIELAAGRHRLRFTNLVEGANVDFVTFVAKRGKSITTVYPPKTDGPDKNPLKGFGSGWWRADDDFATVGFQYLEWGKFEPRDDDFDFDYVEEVLDRPGTRGRHLILQFVVDWDYREPVSENYVGPKWLLERVGEHVGTADPDDPRSRPMRATKYNSPAYVTEATEAIQALTEYFAEDPRVFILQVGLLGFWSEWHTFPRSDWSPADRTKRALLDAYVKTLPAGAFTQIRYPDEKSVKPRFGMGYSNGSATPTDHGYDFGKKVGATSLWENGPITGEWPPNVEDQYWERFFVTEEGTEFIEQARYTTLLMPEAKDIRRRLPDWTVEGSFLEMHRRLGYSFQLDRVRHVVLDDGVLHFELSLRNAGIAPFYADWEMQVGLLDAEGLAAEHTVSLSEPTNAFAPGQSIRMKGKFAQSIQAEDDLVLAFRIVQKGADQPKSAPWRLEPRNVYIQLANEIEIVPARWSSDNSLMGGWNVLCPVENKPSATEIARRNFFPFAGSVRPVSDDR